MAELQPIIISRATLLSRYPLRGAARGTLQILTAALAASVEGGAAVRGIRAGVPASAAGSAGGNDTAPVSISDETPVVPEEPERGLSVPQHLRAASVRE